MRSSIYVVPGENLIENIFEMVFITFQENPRPETLIKLLLQTRPHITANRKHFFNPPGYIIHQPKEKKMN